ncbi:helix-turn-helix domain-containing protein [Streptomyces pristinaespiralis]|uniref:helix-turn-helix domain-containing protein n=1 Tax=Streptomyces pristinaespiralis TaxID=38300 RepID=UPI0038511ADB
MAPGHVAYGLRAQYGMQVTPETVTAWERGLAVPGTRELTALAGVLWCSPGELLSTATSLREHRIARGLAPDELARRLGMDAHAYLRMEESGRWRGNERQTAALAGALGLSPRELLAATGRDKELAELLRGAVTSRWQAYVRPVGRMLPLERGHLQDVLQQLHTDYQSRMVATLSWGAAVDDTGEPGREFLDRIVDHFWDLAKGPLP